MKIESRPIHPERPERRGGWFLTASGRQFWPLDARPEDVCIEDIAHGLSQVCRFGGHCRKFYSVAQHSVVVASFLPPGLRRLGLLHDATEAYIGDMVRPLKLCMPDYQQAEKRLWRVICEAFGLPRDPHPHPEVKAADNLALMTERRDIMPVTSFSWGPELEAIQPHPRRIVPVSSPVAKSAFLAAFFHDIYLDENSAPV